MSSANPPYPYYNGIPFNPSFFTSDTSSGLTETAANDLYLRKTTPDAATALETFNGGISVVGPTTLSAPITSAYTVVPTSGQIGYLSPAIFRAGDTNLATDPQTMTALTSYSVAKVVLTAGTWILNGAILGNLNTNTGYIVCALTPTIGSINFTTDYYVQSVNNATLNLGYLVTRIVQITAPQSYFLTARTNVAASSQVINTYRLTAVRVA